MKRGDILDVGCGNGYTTRQIADTFPDAMVSGIDFSPDMITEAKKNRGKNLGTDLNLDFYEGDVLSLSRNPALQGEQFDVVLSSRCLINLANWEEQKIGILEMRKMLKPDGHLILVENVQDGLDNLNHLRTNLGLDPIQPRWHNQLIPQAGLEKFFREIQGQLLTVEYVENIGNFYYLASRVLYAKICKDQGIEPDYNNPINAVAAKMPTMGEHYACSPNFMFILRNEGGGGSWDNKRLSS